MHSAEIVVNEADAVEARVRRWLEQVVVGLGLCPFAAAPVREERVRICVSQARDELALLTDLELELRQLDAVPPIQLETTVMAVPFMLADFLEYNDFLDRVDELLTRGEWEGDYQVATFHPRYQFSGTHPDDAGNLTNRAPYPLLHLLREASVEAALACHPDPDRIPQDNIRRVQALSAEQIRCLFGPDRT